MSKQKGGKLQKLLSLREAKITSDVGEISMKMTESDLVKFQVYIESKNEQSKMLSELRNCEFTNIDSGENIPVLIKERYASSFVSFYEKIVTDARRWRFI